MAWEGKRTDMIENVLKSEGLDDKIMVKDISKMLDGST
jgi:hypothetical protein